MFKFKRKIFKNAKTGDKVFGFFGWGRIIDIKESPSYPFPLTVHFEKNGALGYYNLYGESINPLEDRLTQEEPHNEHFLSRGDVVVVYNNLYGKSHLRYFYGFKGNMILCFSEDDEAPIKEWKYFKRLTADDVSYLKLKPEDL